MPERRKKKNLKSTRHALTRKAKKPAAKKTVKKAAKAAPKTTAKKEAAQAASTKNGVLSIYDLNGKSVDTLQLDPLFHDGAVNTDVIYQAVLMYQAGEREGTAATKDRGHVRGGGKKPWKQKGTGQARHGSRRSPIWRGGGTTFGPMPRDYSYSIPAQIKRRAVVEGVKDKVHNGKMFVVSQLEIKAPKTKIVAGILNVFKLRKPLIVVDEKSDNLTLASRNIPDLSVKTAAEMNALDVASHQECLMTKAAYAGLVKRLKS